jgi:hypothetical protein
MKCTLSAVAFAFFVTWAQPAPAQELPPPIVGVWKYASIYDKDLATGSVTYPQGENPGGQLIYTKGGHFAFLLVGDNRKPPASSTIADAERIQLFKAMASASGAYKVEGKDLIMTFNASWNQSWTGTTQKRQFEIVGNKLTVTSPPVKSVATGHDIIFVVTYERVE